ncbi:MAG: structural protein [Flavobacterium sp.]|nr:structural protein [Flavobacterium sp.]MBE98741.1 structural protein [Flavobacterium sp.]
MENSQFTDRSLPRGIRNNNPGNIEKTGDAWQGLASVQPDSRFFTFSDPVYGVRALAKIIRNYRDRYGINTVQGIINRWAPPIENNTGAYVQAVASAVGVGPTEPLTWDAGQLRALVSSIIHHENGQQPYSMALIDDGISRAGWA